MPYDIAAANGGVGVRCGVRFWCNVLMSIEGHVATSFVSTGARWHVKVVDCVNADCSACACASGDMSPSLQMRISRF
jgi:hypothetical protein